MARRHFFDKGYPVTSATLFAGSQVLLALSRRSLQLSRQRIALSNTRLADTSERMLNTLIRRRMSQSGDRFLAFAAGHQRRS